MHSVVDRLLVDNMRILSLADHISATLARPSTKIHLEELSFEIIDFNDRTLRMHLYRQDHAMLAVIREHGEDDNAVFEAAAKTTSRIEAQLLALRRAVELGEPLRRPLEETEFVLREYVDQSESTILPWVKKTLGGTMLEEVDRRIEEIDGPEDSESVTVELFDR